MNRKLPKNILLTEGLLALVTAFFTIAMFTFLKSSCSSEMHCHEASGTVRNLAIVMTLIALVQLLAGLKIIRLIGSIVLYVLSVITLLVPGTIMTLCMMPQMSCRSVMKPGVTVFCAFILVLGLINIFFTIRRKA